MTTHFIPDRRFALVRGCCGLINVFDVVGFRYDPTKDHSEPVVITKKTGAHTFTVPSTYMLWDRRDARVSGNHMTPEQAQLSPEAIERINEHERHRQEQMPFPPWIVGERV
jgi:hypothetical protein